MHWEPLPSGSTGKILAYEVGTKTRKYKVKENISTRNCPTGEDEGKTAAVGKTTLKQWSVLYLQARLEVALLPPIVPD